MMRSFGLGSIYRIRHCTHFSSGNHLSRSKPGLAIITQLSSVPSQLLVSLVFTSASDWTWSSFCLFTSGPPSQVLKSPVLSLLLVSWSCFSLEYAPVSLHTLSLSRFCCFTSGPPSQVLIFPLMPLLLVSRTCFSLEHVAPFSHALSLSDWDLHDFNSSIRLKKSS